VTIRPVAYCGLSASFPCTHRHGVQVRGKERATNRCGSGTSASSRAARTLSCLHRRNSNCTVRILVVRAASGHEARVDGSFHVRLRTLMPLNGAVLHLLIQDPKRGKEEVENWRQRTRHPSVPSDSFQLAPQQVSYVDSGFDLSIPSFPLMCLSPDGSRLCPSVAESTPSVPPFSLALSLSRTLQTSSGALSRSNTASLVQETLSSQLDICSPFLLDQSLLKASFLIGCSKEPVHVSRYEMLLLPEYASLTCSCKVSTALSHESLLIHTQTHLRYLTETSQKLSEKGFCWLHVIE
jgi:hypothetical protein